MVMPARVSNGTIVNHGRVPPSAVIGLWICDGTRNATKMVNDALTSNRRFVVAAHEPAVREHQRESVLTVPRSPALSTALVTSPLELASSTKFLIYAIASSRPLGIAIARCSTPHRPSRTREPGRLSDISNRIALFVANASIFR